VLTAITRDENEVAGRAIIEAQGEVAGYLAARYDIFTEFEKTADAADRVAMTVKLVRDIAIYNCHQFSAPVNMPPTRVYAYEAAVRFLRDVQAEKASIPELQRLNLNADGTTSSNYLYYSGNSKRDHHI
jgi:phage gp36-like protein